MISQILSINKILSISLLLVKDGKHRNSYWEGPETEKIAELIFSFPRYKNDLAFND